MGSLVRGAAVASKPLNPDIISHDQQNIGWLSSLTVERENGGKQQQDQSLGQSGHAGFATVGVGEGFAHFILAKSAFHFAGDG